MVASRFPDLHDSDELSGIMFSKGSVHSGSPENDPAVHSDGKIKNGCSIKDFGFELFADSNFMEKGLTHGRKNSRGGQVVMVCGGPICVRSKLQSIQA